MFITPIAAAHNPPLMRGKVLTHSSLPSGDTLSLRFAGAVGKYDNNLERMQQVISMLLGEFNNPMPWDAILKKVDVYASEGFQAQEHGAEVSAFYQQRFALLTTGDKFAEWEQISERLEDMKRLAAEGKADGFDGRFRFFRDKDAVKTMMLNLLKEDEQTTWPDFVQMLAAKSDDRPASWSDRMALSVILGIAGKSGWTDISGAADAFHREDHGAAMEFDALLKAEREERRENGQDVSDDMDFGDLLDKALAEGFFES